MTANPHYLGKLWKTLGGAYGSLEIPVAARGCSRWRPDFQGFPNISYLGIENALCHEPTKILFTDYLIAIWSKAKTFPVSLASKKILNIIS